MESGQGSSAPQKVLQLQHREHSCITAWYSNCSASDRKALQRVVRKAQFITGAKLPAIQHLYTLSKTPATPVIDCSLCYRTKSGTKRLLNSIYPKAKRLLNR